MGLHQIIYTSCKRGIDGINDGQQIYSYDASFKDAGKDDIRRLFTYQAPALEDGMVMTEEIAPTLPRSFMFRRLENGSCALVLNTYLGRDYMGSAGRFGNQLSHVIVSDDGLLPDYPCEYFGTAALRDHMEFEEVNNPEKPDYLPVPELSRGYQVDVETVMEFLNQDGRMEIFKDMVCAMLAYSRERKRLVICDERENVILWIAALEYTLPRTIAQTINFSTYDYNPNLSASRICGVIPRGTDYTPEQDSYHFVFDFYRQKFPTFEKDPKYFELIDTAMSISYESLQDFHSFLTKGYRYCDADEKLYAAYRLYTLLYDGVSSLNGQDLKEALDFAEKFALPQEQQIIAKNILGRRKALLGAELPMALDLLHYMQAHDAGFTDTERAGFKTLAVDKVLHEFLNNTAGESVFMAAFDQINTLCRQSGFSLSAELMLEDNRKKLFTVLGSDSTSWKISFVVKVLCAYVRDQHIPVQELTNDHSLGQTFYGLVHAVYAKDPHQGGYLVSQIMDEFAADCNYLINMALNVEGMLLDLPIGEQEAPEMWRYVFRKLTQEQSLAVTRALTILHMEHRDELVLQLYQAMMLSLTETGGKAAFFDQFYRSFVAADPDFAARYQGQLLQQYYEGLQGDRSREADGARRALFELLTADKKLQVSFAEDLIQQIVDLIPLAQPTPENGKLIQKAFQYQYNYLNRPVGGKLQLLVIGLVLNRCGKTEEVQGMTANLSKLVRDGKTSLSHVPVRTLEPYFTWFLPDLCILCQQLSDLEGVYNLFSLTGERSDLYFNICTEAYMQQGKNIKNSKLFCEFLGFVIKKGSETTQKQIGKRLHKMNKQKMLDLENAMLQRYKGQKEILHTWHQIKAIAEEGNPFMSALTSLFRRPKVNERPAQPGSRSGASENTAEDSLPRQDRKNNN